MATKTINQFGVITSLAVNDKIPLWQNSSAATKAITYGNFITQVIASLTLSDYVRKDGTVALTGDWDIGASRKISGDKLAARSGSGMRLEDDGGNLGVFVKDGGFVGVACTDPLAKFQVGAGTDSPTTGADLYVADAGTASVVVRDCTNDVEAAWLANATTVIFGAVTTHPLEFRTNNAARMTIASGGDIGMGTAAPVSNLDVAEDGGAGSANAPIITIRNTFDGLYTAADQRVASLDFYSNDLSGGGAGVRARVAAENDNTAGSTTNLGFYTSNNANVLTKVLHLDTNGNAGIGNATPQASLHVGVGADAPATTATIYASLTGAVSAVLRDSTNDVEGKWTAGTASVIFGAVTNHPLAIYTNNTERVTVLAAGNVGVGNTSPQALLHVGAGADAPSVSNTILHVTNAGATNMSVRNSTDNIAARITASAVNVIIGVSTNHELAIYTNNLERVTIQAAGNVGIGNVAPQALLHVGAGADAPGVTNTALYVSNAGATGVVVRNSTDNIEARLTASALNIIFGSSTNHDLALYTNNTEKVTILAAGNVGVGNTAPGALLHVGAGADAPATGNTVIYASLAGSAALAIRNSTADVENSLRAGASTGSVGTTSNHDLALLTNNAVRITILADGKVGIGDTTPSYELDVAGTVNATALYQGGAPFIGSQWTVVGAGINYSGGNVGIGDATPGATLEVNGNIRAGYDLDVASHFGRAFIGYDGANSDSATFGHIDQTNGALYAIRHDGANGNTTVRGWEAILLRIGAFNICEISATSFKPFNDNLVSCGESGQRWTAVYAVNGTIQTSDLTEKRSVQPSSLGLDFIRRLTPIQWIWRDRDEPAEVETVTFERPVMETVTVEKPALDRTGSGKLVKRTKPVEVKRQRMEFEPLFHENGKPVFDKDGNQILEAVPVFETVTEERIVKPAIQQIHKRPHFGLAGQQVKQVIDELGTDFAGYIYDPERDEHSLRYSEFIGPMIRAIQELTAMVESQANRLAVLEGMKS